jgi:predicted AlkP superfamily pyrophosphatase or phosphodiesterase
MRILLSSKNTLFRFLLYVSIASPLVLCAAPAPLVIMVGIDGLRADTLDRMPLPNLQALAKSGVRANMIPAMPSKTFVNFYSLATGLYPNHHGITSNYPYDKKMGRKFDRQTDVSDPRWWGGEPIWNTAEKQGLVAATYFWVGSEAPIGDMRATYWKPYEQNKDYAERVEEVLSWLLLPESKRPNLVMLYFSAVDTATHIYGVDSAEERAAVASVDKHVGDLILGVKQGGLFQQANIVVVADHGMSNLSDERLINLDKVINLAKFEVSDWNNRQKPVYAPFLSLYGDDNAIESAYKQLVNINSHVKTYRRGAFPTNYHVDHPDRGPDLMLMADEGWTLYASKNQQEPQTMAETGRSIATHGYDNQTAAMQATFIATGPLFKKNIRAKAFENIEIYGLLSCALGIKPAKTDGDIKRVQGFLTQTCED